MAKLNELSIQELTKGLTEKQMTELYPEIAKLLKIPVDNNENTIKNLSETIESVKLEIADVKKIMDMIDKKFTETKNYEHKSESGFRNITEMIFAVKNFRENGIKDERLDNLKAAGTGPDSLTPSSGGFLVPEEFRNDILGQIPMQSPILSRTTRVPVNGIKINYSAFYDYDRGSGTYFGGVSASYRKEKTQITGTTPVFSEISLEPKEIVAMTAPSLELLNMSVVSLEPILNRMFAFAIAKKKEYGIIKGTGNDQPLGILNAPCKYTVAAESGQTSATPIVPANIIKMVERLPAEATVAPCWIIHPLMISNLVLAKEPIGTGGEMVKWFDFGAKTLLGYPYFISNFCSAPATEGDIILADLTFYLDAYRVGGDMFRTSDDFYFDYVQRAIQVITTFDGQPWWKTTLKLEDNSTEVSPFITLATRS